jgi:hypothetical protein
MATPVSISQDQKEKLVAGQMVYIAPDDLSPNVAVTEDPLLWPGDMIQTDQAYFSPNQLPSIDGTESITEDGSELVAWRLDSWSEDEENVRRPKKVMYLRLIIAADHK